MCGLLAKPWQLLPGSSFPSNLETQLFPNNEGKVLRGRRFSGITIIKHLRTEMTEGKNSRNGKMLFGDQISYRDFEAMTFKSTPVF